MARYPLNLPADLKRQAEASAAGQGVSLNQFILWAVSEKVGELKGRLDDPTFVHVTYRRGASGRPTPVVRGTGVRVQTLLIAAETWGMTPAEIADQLELTTHQVTDALRFCQAHRSEIEELIAADSREPTPDALSTAAAAS